MKGNLELSPTKWEKIGDQEEMFESFERDAN